MKAIIIPIFCIFLFSCNDKIEELPDHYKHVDQVLCIVNDLENVLNHWRILGFDEIMILGEKEFKFSKSAQTLKVKIALANFGGANITWIQPLDGESVFSQFHASYGDGAMALVHRIDTRKNLRNEIRRLANHDVNILEDIKIEIGQGTIHYTIMDTREKGKYSLGFVTGTGDLELWQKLHPSNLHNLQINQYAFAIKGEEPASGYWHSIGLPEFQISHPDLGNKHYYGNSVDHDLIQGWQRHGSVAYEWCIPVSNPIVYNDHILKHGEGIQHLAFSTMDMDRVLEDYRSKNYTVSMGGTWGEIGKPGSGRYEYIDMEEAGGLTIELLWNFRE